MDNKPAHWLTNPLLICLGLFQSMLITSLSLLVSDWLTFPAGSIPYFFAVFFTVGGLTSLWMGWWSDRIGQRLVFLKFFSVASALGLIALSLSSNSTLSVFLIIFTLAPSGVLVGLFFGFLVASGSDQSEVIAARSWYSATWVVGPALAAWFVTFFGFEGLILLMLMLTVVSASIAFRLQEAKGQKIGNQLQTVQSILQISDKVLVVFLLQGAMSITTIALPQVMKNELGGNQNLVGVAFSICAACEVIIMFGLSKMINRFSPPLILLVGALCGFGYYGLFAVVTSANQLVVLQVVNAAYIAVVMGVGLTWFQSAIPAFPTFATMLFVNCYNAGAILVSGIVALLIEQDWKFQQVGLVGAVVIIFAVMLILRGSITTFRVPTQRM